MKVVVAFLTKDKVELSEQTIKPLLKAPIEILWCDGSSTDEGKNFPAKVMMDNPGHRIRLHSNIRGGPDAAVAYALTTMLHGSDWTHMGLHESDVVLPPDWYGKTMGLFLTGVLHELEVGAVSTRAYQDRILIQRDGYAICHNLGWGQQIMTREAARLALRHFRTGWTLENRRVFHTLTGKDIATWWAFRGGEHMITADWHNDAVLAAHGLASLALVPSPVEMIGQTPPLHEQGLAIAREPVEQLRDDKAFSEYKSNTDWLRDGAWAYPISEVLHDGQSYIYFPHQMQFLGSIAEGWRLKFSQGFGPFSWESIGNTDELKIMVLGPCEFIVGGDGPISIEDQDSGYVANPTLESSRGVALLPVPGQVAYRQIVLKAMAPGITFFGLRTREPQPCLTNISFDHSVLPKP